MNYTLTDIAVFLVCSVITSMGMGGGGILILYLISVKDIPQLEAQGINMLFFLPCCLVSIIIYIKNGYIKPKLVLPMLIGSAAGVGIGRVILGSIDTGVLKTLFALFLIVSGFVMIFYKDKKVDK